jgi:NDP-sugar pyrophosphorylase family protein
MRVIVLATDEDAKLRPLTNTYPSPLVPIVNRPVAAITLEILSRAGLKRPLVSVCHRGGRILSLLGTGLRWGVQIEYVFQDQALGTAGALRWAAPWLDETFLVLSADSILDLDIEAAAAYHRTHGGAGTLILHAPFDHNVSNPVAIGEDGRILGLGAPPGGGCAWSYTGAAILEPHLLEMIPFGTHYECYRHLIPALLNAGVELYGYVTDGYWNPLDSFQAYQAAQRAFLWSASPPSDGHSQAYARDARMRHPSLVGQQIAPEVWIERNTVIHPSARLIPPVYIGEAGRIGRDVVVGPDVVLGSNVVVDDEATVAHSIVTEHTYLGRLVNSVGRVVDKTTIIDIHTSQSVQIVDPFLLAEILPAERLRRLHRAAGRAIVLVLLAMLLPLLLVIGCLILATSGGPLLRRQGCTGVPATAASTMATNEPALFHLLAFRTRHPDGSYSVLGHWLSRCGLDQLPELWNVVKGELALVGVKPLPPEIADQVDADWQRKSFECPAGFTGLWYTNTDATHLDEILVADAYYAATQSWREDIRILRHTPVAWWRRCRSSVPEANDTECRQYVDHFGSA